MSFAEMKAKAMKLLFFSADQSEIECVSNALTQAKVACETRETGRGKALLTNFGESELWIKHDKDAYKALMVCVEQGIGFAKRTPIADQEIGYACWDRDDLRVAEQTEEEGEHQKAA